MLVVFKQNKERTERIHKRQPTKNVISMLKFWLRARQQVWTKVGNFVDYVIKELRVKGPL